MSQKIKLVSIVGARPQFIKAAAVSRSIKKMSRIKEVTIHTGQHFDDNMSGIFFKEMGIREPDYNLNINSMSHAAMTGRMMEGIEKILLNEKPHIVLVYGDTDSTLAGALSAKKLHLKLCHIEAGLRSYNLNMPEEINRILTDRISDILFCPSNTAVKNLKKEGYSNFDNKIINSGDVMYDSIIYYSKISSKRSTIIKKLKLKDFILCTIHRAENTDKIIRLKSILSALNEVNKSIKVVLPLHPRTRKIINQYKIKTDILLIDPVGYFDMTELIKNSSLVITDSGGLQKEAYFLKRNCLILRDETEWTELVEHGFTQLAGANKKVIIQKVFKMLNKKSDFSIKLYGNGNASELIVQTLFDYL